MKRGMKRLVSGLLAVVMVLAMFGGNTKAALAEERTMQNYVYDGYEVEFAVIVGNVLLTCKGNIV